MSSAIRCDKCSKIINFDNATSSQKVVCECGSIISLNDNPEDGRQATIIHHSTIQQSQEEMLDYIDENDDLDKKVPDRIGNYEIIRELGRGGMGVVYLANDKKLNRKIAVKVLLAGENATQDTVTRFRREAESAAKLQHSSIVSIFDVGHSKNLHYIAMEYISGLSLMEYVIENGLNNNEKLVLMEKVARAIHFCHENGVLHRDLKPSNILITEQGEPKIMDFGLAKATTVDDQKLTRSGVIIGTPAYMAPEQAESSNKTGKLADVYSLGAILYELLCGETPFSSQSTLNLLYQVINEDPTPLFKVNRKINNDINTVVMKCLEKDPDNRYHSAEKLADDLKAVINSEPISASPPSTVRRVKRVLRKNKFAASLIGSALVVGICVLFIMKLYQEKEGVHTEKDQLTVKADISEELESYKLGDKTFTMSPEFTKLISSDFGKSVLAGEIDSSSDTRCWSAIKTVTLTDPTKYKEQVFKTFVKTENKFVELAAYEYLKNNLSPEEMKSIIDKKDGLRNFEVTKSLLTQYMDATNIDRMSKLKLQNLDLVAIQSDVLEKEQKATGVKPYIYWINKHNDKNNSFVVLDVFEKNLSWGDNFVSVVEGLLARNQSPEVRSRAALLLGKLKMDRATNILIKALAKEVEEVRMSIISALGNHKNEKASQTLTKILEKESNKEMILVTIDSIVKLGAKSSEESLIKHLENSKDVDVRAKSAEALGLLDCKNATKVLVKKLGDSDVLVRAKAAEALGRIKDPKSIDDLISAFKENSDDNLRVSIAMSLANMKSKKAIAMLVQAARGIEAENLKGAKSEGKMKKSEMADVEVQENTMGFADQVSPGTQVKNDEALGKNAASKKQNQINDTKEIDQSVNQDKNKEKDENAQRRPNPRRNIVQDRFSGRAGKLPVLKKALKTRQMYFEALRQITGKSINSLEDLDKLEDGK